MTENTRQQQQERNRLLAAARAKECAENPAFAATNRNLTRAMVYWGCIVALDRLANLFVSGTPILLRLASFAVLLVVATFAYFLVVNGSRTAALMMILGSGYSLLVLIRPLFGAASAGWYKILMTVLLLPQISLLVVGIKIALSGRVGDYCKRLREMEQQVCAELDARLAEESRQRYEG